MIALEKVSSVYSGKNGKCCCGCSGKHSYASQHREFASSRRGYNVTDKEISDRSVKTIVNKMNNYPGEIIYENGHVYLEHGNRLYIAYMIP